MTYKCIIIDDEQPARKLLENYCNKLGQMEVLGSFKSALDALPILNEQPVDILFLDIQMPEISGLDFLRILKNQHLKVILTTAYRDYALEGFELDVIDYLLKPIAFFRFVKAIDKVKQIASVHKPSSFSEQHQMLTIKSGKKTYRIPKDEILYIKSENEYLKYFTKQRGNILVYGAIKNAVTDLAQYSEFFRVHRSYIINIRAIDYVEGHRICIGQTFITISEGYRQTFFEAWH